MRICTKINNNLPEQSKGLLRSTLKVHENGKFPAHENWDSMQGAS
jgi:hypothetical protein